MTESRPTHTADEFGKQGSGLAGMDAPMIGAAGAIFSDALTERESGVTPSPPAVSVMALAVVLLVMFLAGSVGLGIFLAVQRAAAPKDYPFVYSAEGTGGINGDLNGIGTDSLVLGTSLSSTPEGQSRYQEPELTYDSSTRFLINGRPLSTSASSEDTITLYDVNGWPVRIEYKRVPGSASPLATRVEFQASESDIQGAFGSP